MKNRLAIILVAVGFGLGLVFTAWVAWLIVRRPAPPVLAGGASAIVQIQSLSELVTVKYVVEKIITYDDPKYFADLVPLGENKLILLAHGVAKAGVDLSRLKSEDVVVTEGRIRVTLPPATLTDVYLDEKRTQVLDRQTGLLRRFDKNLERTARQYAVTEVQRAARLGGIEREANERAREQLGNLLKTLGYKEVEVLSTAR